MPMEGENMSERKPMVLVFAGPNGSGKTTIKELFQIRLLADIPELLSICDILHVYDNTERATRIVRKHKDQLSIFPNEYWTEEQLFNLIGIHS